MSNLNRHPVRRATASVLAGTLALTGAALAAGVSPANAQAGFTFDRLQGVDRYGTAAAIALNGTTFDNSDTVILASGATRNFPDALTGNYLAGEIDGPILLTDPNRLPAVTARAIGSLNVKKVIIVGGTSAVSAGVERQVNQLSDVTVQRIGGIDRYDTGELVASNVRTGGQRATGVGTGDDSATATVGLDPQGRRTAVLGNGQDFPDILAAGPLGYAEAFPITITRPTALPAQTRRTLVATGVKRVVIVGGTTAVSTSVETEVRALNGGIEVVRLAGVLRFETATKIADFAYDQLGFDANQINLARSDDFADALTGGPHGGEDRAPIVISTPTVLNENTAAYLKARACTVRNGHILGGTAAISASVKTAAEAAARDTSACGAAAATPTATITVTPDNAVTATATPTMNTTAGDNNTADDRTFFAGGLTQGETYRVTLVKCANVQGDGRNAKFLSEAAAGSVSGFAAVTGAPVADIVRVNGAATTDSDTATVGIQTGSTTFVAATSGASFVVDGDGAECIVPVVYYDSSTKDPSDGGNITRLEVQGPAGQFGAPVEEYDTGGRTTFVVG